MCIVVLYCLYVQLSELEGSLDMTRQELGRLRTHGAEQEERWHTREQELLLRLEDSRNKEKKLEDQKHNLEICLSDTSQQIQELKVNFTSLNLLICNCNSYNVIVN